MYATGKTINIFLVKHRGQKLPIFPKKPESTLQNRVLHRTKRSTQRIFTTDGEEVARYED